MPPRTNSELVTIERTAIVVAKLMRGGTVTVTDVARLAECTERHARTILDRVSRVITVTDENGLWWYVGNN